VTVDNIGLMHLVVYRRWRSHHAGKSRDAGRSSVRRCHV